MPRKSLQVILAQPRGFCAGVVRAVDIVERALERFGAPVYVRHEIVHNQHVVDKLRAKGALFVDEIHEIPENSVTVFSAHGVSRKVVSDAATQQLEVIDATCPLVTKVHNEARRYVRRGHEIILIGHAGHPEVEGTMGQVDGTVHLVETEEDVARLEIPPDTKLAYVTQTTLSVDDTRGVIEALKERFPEIVGPDVKDICYATQNRQGAVREMSEVVDTILVVGARNSSNSNRLRELGEECGVPSYLIADATKLDPTWFSKVDVAGVTAGASAPESLVQGVLHRLSTLFDVTVTNLDGVEENVHFKLPKELINIL